MSKRLVYIAVAAVILLALGGSTDTFASNNVNLAKVENRIEVISSDYTKTGIKLLTGNFDWQEISVGGTKYAQINIDNYGFTNEIGKPELPLIRKMVQIPMGAEVSIEVVSVNKVTYNLTELGIDLPIYPAQKSVSKANSSSNPDDFIIDTELYATDGFYKSDVADLFETGMIRGYRFATIDIYPISYNPVKAQIEVATDIEIELLYDGADQYDTEYALHRYYSPDYEYIARKNFVNYSELVTDFPPSPIGMIVVVANRFWENSSLDEYIAWKSQKGFYMDVQNANDLGGSTTGIKAYLQEQYDNAPIPPTYVLFIGDVDGIPTWDGETGWHVTDLTYGTLAGHDYFPDVELGRFSAQDASQLETIIEKAVDYEQLWHTNGIDWTNKACFIASDDPWFWDVAEGTHRYVIQTHMDPNGIESDSIWGHSGGHTQDIIDALNDGRMICNYSGHGSNYSWAGPVFQINHVLNLTNDGMYPFVISNACITGSFNLDECFMEAWVRAPRKGAFASLGASNSTYWDEDDWWERAAYDAFFWRGFYTIYGMNYSGNLAVYNQGSYLAEYYFEVYNILGDPSTMPWVGYPDTMEVTHADQISFGQASFEVHCEAGEPLENVLVSLWKDGTLHGTAYTDESGDAVVTLDPPPSETGDMYITCTHLNHVPVQHTVPVGPGINVALSIQPDSTELHRGGRISYTITLENNEDSMVTFDCWSMMELPNHDMYGPVLGPLNNVSFPANSSASAHFANNIPMVAPVGNYTYYAYCGDYPSEIQVSTSFDFQIVAVNTESSASMARGWDIVNYSGGFGDILHDDFANIPARTELLQNYPNPFNPHTSIRYSLERDSQVELQVYNLRGESVSKLIDGNQSAGWHEVIWDATDSDGVKVSSGIYFYRLVTGGEIFTRKMSLIK
ncbi:MAG: T9SS type A sorting domain-containing protein [candidate division Zixibacteria bacterium]|nr:T9SS type A sorting domain-containing protein [candidate division Zixibacteria bacterium]